MSEFFRNCFSYLKMTPIGKTIRRHRYNKRLLYSTSKAKAAIEKYAGDLPETEKEKLLEDVLKTAKKYRFTFDEFFNYEFQTKTEEERIEFIPDLERIDIVESINKAKNLPIFDDKYKTYSRFKEYYKRDVLFIDKKSKMNGAFETFARKHPEFIIKPIDGTCGNGVRKISAKDVETEQLYEQLTKEYPKGFILEELIEQVEELAQLHPQSVNTVRVFAVRLDSETVILHPILRVGQHGSVVDNAGAGGIICVLNKDTGIVEACADEYGNHYEVHPDTNEKLVGFCVPQWNEAVRLVEELVQVVPDNRYTGWDIALSKDKGWIMVEGNARGQIGWQRATMVGARKEIYSLLKEMNVKVK